MKGPTLTKEQAIKRLVECQEDYDIDGAHRSADKILCALLVELGYAEVVAEFEKVDKWYS